MYKYLFVWLNLNNGTYYYKLLNHSHSEYYVGYINQYNHRLVLMDKIVFLKDKSYFDLKSIKKRAMRNVINFLEKNI